MFVRCYNFTVWIKYLSSCKFMLPVVTTSPCVNVLSSLNILRQNRRERAKILENKMPLKTIQLTICIKQTVISTKLSAFRMAFLHFSLCLSVV